MSTYFISDLHLDPLQPAVLDALQCFLHSIVDDADSLYVLGDLFEMWIGDDDNDPFMAHCCAALKAFSDCHPLFVLHGNRDFLMGAGFSERSGAQLLPDPHVIDLHGRRAMVMHGDSLCIDDAAYTQLRQQFRSAVWQQDVLARPLAERRSFGASLRAQSRAANANKAAAIMDVNEQQCALQCELHAVDLLIHGHTHRPGTHRYDAAGSRTRIVLGDWHPEGTVLQVTSASEFRLLSTHGLAAAVGAARATGTMSSQSGRPE